MSRELLKQALYALKYHSIQTRPIDLTNETIEALRQELAKPEQEPAAWMYKGNFHDFDPSEWASPEFVVTPLYTAPPRKEWVGLTDEDKKRYDLERIPEWALIIIEELLRKKNT